MTIPDEYSPEDIARINTRVFVCKGCGTREECRPTLVRDGERWICIYGSGVDNCTHCDKFREDGEEKWWEDD